jgi:hypothetical protein
MNAVAPLKPQHIDAEIVSSLVTTGDLSRLTAMQKVQLYNYRCAQVGLDPAAKPFDLLKLNGKEILYANAGCTQQLAQLHKLSVEIISRDKVEDLFIVHARVKDAEGRSTDNTGAVAIGNLKGEALANAIMKATTKAIRRTVLAHVGLGMMDETEVETIPGAIRTVGLAEAAEPPHEEIARRFMDALRKDYEGATEEAVEAARAQGIMAVHSVIAGDDDLYQAAWKLLDAPSRRAIKTYIDMARKAA